MWPPSTPTSSPAPTCTRSQAHACERLRFVDIREPSYTGDLHGGVSFEVAEKSHGTFTRVANDLSVVVHCDVLAFALRGSEHTIDGRQFAMEMHVVTQSAPGQLLGHAAGGQPVC